VSPEKVSAAWSLPAPRSSSVLSTVSEYFQSDTPPDLRALTDGDFWGCRQGEERRVSISRQLVDAPRSRAGLPVCLHPPRLQAWIEV
jgi:hypothetical protein